MGILATGGEASDAGSVFKTLDDLFGCLTDPVQTIVNNLGIDRFPSCEVERRPTRVEFAIPTDDVRDSFCFDLAFLVRRVPPGIGFVAVDGALHDQPVAEDDVEVTPLVAILLGGPRCISMNGKPRTLSAKSTEVARQL